MQPIVVLGLGNMGRAMALRFIQRGYQVMIWNRTPQKAAELLEAGAIWLEKPGNAGLHSNIVFSMVADDLASEAIWLGDQGALRNMRPGSYIIECSTLSKKHVDHLAGLASKQSLNYIDCPVTGLPAAALKGELTLLVGAEPASLEQVKSVLNEISTVIRYFGKPGSGTAYKLMINLMGAVQIAALAEGVALSVQLGLDRETVIAAIENSAAASPQVIRYVRPMVEKKFSDHPVFTIGLRKKDAEYGISLAEGMGSPILLGKAALSLFAGANPQNALIDEASIINFLK